MLPIKSDLTAPRLKELFFYNSESGVVTRRISKKGAAAGALAGRKMQDGYWQVKVDGRAYMLHRIIWLYTYGEWPKACIDHIDGNRANNRIANLRDVSYVGNAQNKRKANADNITGILGVTAHKCGKYQTQIRVDGKVRYLGLFVTPEKAHAVYLNAKRRLHPCNTL